MGYAENRGDYWRARFKLATGKYDTVKDETGATVRFRSRREAQKAADDAEAAVRANRHRDPAAGRETFGEYASRWFAVQDLAASTMQNYRHHIEEHLLPVFEDVAMADILMADVAAWEKRERAAGYAEASIKTWRSTLHLILADAVDEGLRESNPAARRRGRGKRAGRSQRRGPEKAVTSASGILHLGERRRFCPAETMSSSPLCSRASRACAGVKSSVWSRSMSGRPRSGSSGSCMNSTRGS